MGRRFLCTVVGIAIVLAACGSSSKGASSSTATTPTSVVDKTLGTGVDASTIKVGIALVDFTTIAALQKLTRTKAEQQQIYNIFIDDINKNGGINGRKLVPYYKFYSPLGTAATGILSVCTALTEDDNVFVVMGSFVDFSGDAQACVSQQHKRVLDTLYLTQAIIDKAPPGLMVTPSDIPDRAAPILVELLTSHHMLDGKTVAVMGDTSQAKVVNESIVPALKKAGVKLGTTALLSIGTSGDYTAAMAQLDSFMERWKGEGVNAVFLSGDQASNKPFVMQLKKEFPDLMLMADTTDVLSQAQEVQQSGVKPNPYEGILTAGGLTAAETDQSPSWKYCADIYQAATGQPAPDAEHTLRTPQGYIHDVNGAISEACTMLSLFQNVATRVGPYLNNANWVSAVDNYGNIATRGLGPYASLRTGKYSADDTWRLQEYDSSLSNSGQWKPVTPVQNITGS